MKIIHRITILGSLFICLNSYAQYVPIDQSFANALTYYGYGSCVHGTMLDTTDPIVSTTTTLAVSDPGLTDVTGVEYFRNLQTFDCTESALTFLPTLPDGLSTLYCRNNQISSISSLPSNLTYLSCDFNQLTSLPTLPVNLNTLYCPHNQLTTLPAPTYYLYTLDCSYNNLTSLPSTFTTALGTLICNNNNLTSLPELPMYLSALVCDSNPQLTCFPYLPNNCTISYTGTAISCIPNYPPNSTGTPALRSLPQCTTGNPDGCYVYLDAGPDQNSCAGQSITTAAIADSGTWIPLASNPAATLISNPSSAVTTIGPFPTSGTYGFIWTTVVGSDTLTITANTAPVADAGPSVFRCQPGPVVTIGGTPTASGGSGVYQYRWWPQLNITSLYVANPVVTPFSGMNQIYEITVTDSVSGCTSVDTMRFLVPTASVYIDASLDTIAAGGSSTLTAYGNQLGANYVWSPLIGLTPAAGNATTEIAAPTSTQTYTVIYSLNGCADTAFQTIYVVPAPYAGPDQTICQNTSATMAATGAGTWSAAPGNPCATTIVNPAASTTTIVNFGCAGVYHFYWTNAGVRDTVIITVSPQLILDAGPTAYVCAGSSVHLGGAPTASGGSGHYQYRWTPGAGLSSVTSANPTAYPPSYVIYSVNVTDSVSGCQMTDTVSVYVTPNSLVLTDSVQNMTCHNANDGSISITAMTGTSPYNYVWTGGTTLHYLNGLSAGTYAVTVSDANSCTATRSEVITNPAPLVAAIDSIHGISCYGAGDGSMCVSITGGTAPYSQLWANGSTLSCVTNVVPTNWWVYATDANGCVAEDSIIITEPAQMVVTDTVSNIRCHGASDGYICTGIIGGTAPYTFLWSNFSVGPCQINLSVGTYHVIATDVNGCQARDSAVIVEPSAITITDSIRNSSCPGAPDGGICLTVTGGTPGYTYIWTPTLIGPCPQGLAIGTYPVQVTDANGCTATRSETVLSDTSCVWPGDADNNRLVDNNDLLPIGLGYDSTGFSRIAASIVWQAYGSIDWANVFTNYTPNVNFKHADCNGDGIIDANDTVAIMQNFGLTHSKANGASRPWRTGLSAIYPVLTKDTVTNGDTLRIDINLGDVSLSATDVYGIAFSINYDATVVDTTMTSMSFDNSWLGSATDQIAIYKDLKSQGVIKAAITRIDHTTRSGQGQIAHFRAIVTTDNIDGKDLQYYGFHCNISDVTAVDATGRVIDLNEGADSSAVAYTPLGVEDINSVSEQIALYPNPANNFITIASGKAAIQSIDVIDMIGANVGSYTFADRNKEHTLSLQNLSSGIYSVVIKTQYGPVTRKVSVNH